MKAVRIFRHMTGQGPGYFGEFLRERQIPFELINIDQQMPVPPSLDDVSGLVFMGGPMSVHDDLPWIGQEIDLIQRADQRRIPLLGHCLGGQLISLALGAEVHPNPVKAIGWHAVRKVSDSAWTRDLQTRFTPYQWHAETFTLPPEAEHLLTSDHCRNQAYARDRVLALQFHLEITDAMVRDWSQRHADEINVGQQDFPDTIDAPEQHIAGITQHLNGARMAADILYGEWISRLG